MTTPIPVTIPMIFVRHMLSGVRIEEQEFTRYLREAGIMPEQLDVEDARVTADQYIALFRTFIERRDDEALGFLSRPLKCGSFALMARSAASAPKLETAIRRTADTFRLLQDDMRIVSMRAGGLAGIELRIANPQTAASECAHELMLRVFWRLFAWLIGGRLPVARFDFAFPASACAKCYEQIFSGELRFEQEVSAFWFDAELLAAPVCRDGQALRDFLGRSYAEVIVPSRESGVTSRVRRYLQQTQPDWPDLPRTAEALHMAASTLQRRLAAEGVTFQELKNNLRRDLAIFRLQTSQVSICKLSAELGFADTAGFQRAFKLWTGSPPGAYQRKDQQKKGRGSD